MNEQLTSRRRMIASVAVTLGGLAAGARSWAQSAPAKPEQPATGPDAARTALHQEREFSASPKRLYEVLLSSKEFAAFSGEPAEIGRKAGSAFKMFGGKIEGRNVELIPGRRIVQAWRPAHWDAGIYSIVRFELKTHDSGSTVMLDHTGFPEGQFGNLDYGWGFRYWKPMKKYLA